MNKALKILAIGTLSIAGQQAQAVSIEFDYSYDSNNFFDTQAKKNVLESAGNFFGSRITDSLSSINSTSKLHFNAGFFHPGTGVYDIYKNDFDIASNTLKVYAGGRELGGTTLGVGGFGGYSISASGTTQAEIDSFFDSSISRGQGDGTQAAVAGAAATEFASWGGSISFDSTSAWYFDNDVSTLDTSATGVDKDLLGSNDFYSVALHELAHLLGFGTADSWDNQVGSGVFTGTNSGVVTLASGNSHWQDGTMSLVDAITSQETAMDPNITTGTRKYFTDLDLAALKDVGWEVSAVPVPAAVYFFGSALLGLGAFRKKVK